MDPEELTPQELAAFQQMMQAPAGPDPMDSVLSMAGPQEAPDPTVHAPPPMPMQAPVSRRPLRDVASQATGEDFTPAAPRVKDQFPSERSAGAGKSSGHVDPELAFFAAFSQNPVLQQMVTESRNRPKADADMARLASGEHRAQEKHAWDRSVMDPLKAEGMRNKNALGASQVDETKPGTPYAQAMTDASQRALRMNAARMSDPILSQQMLDAARDISTGKLSPKQIKDVLAQFPGIADRVVKDSQVTAAQAETKRSHMAGEQLGYAKLAEQRRRAAAAGEKNHQLMVLKPQEKLNKEINELDQALVNMGEIGELKKHVNTGVYVDALAKFTNKWIDSNLTSDKRKELEALVARVFNKEVKHLAGSAVSAAEWARIEPQIPSTADDDASFASKLAKAIAVTADILGKRREEYQRSSTGGPSDQSTTAAKNVRAATAAGEKPMPAAGGASAVGGTEKEAKAAKARRAIASPDATPAAKAGAKKWLTDNGY